MRSHYSPEVFIPYPYSAYNYEPISNVSSKDKSFLAAASKLALTSDNRFRMACIVVRSGSVLGADINVTKVSPSTPPNRFSTHAEMGAIQSVSDPYGSTLYISRLKVDNSTASARPCSWCMQHLISKGVYRVVYTTDFRYPESFYISTVIWKDDIL